MPNENGGGMARIGLGVDRGEMPWYDGWLDQYGLVPGSPQMGVQMRTTLYAIVAALDTNRFARDRSSGRATIGGHESDLDFGDG